MNEQTRISENVSEKQTKRGRPQVFGPLERMEALLVGESSEVSTSRGVANIAYQQRAIRVLRDDPRFYWLGMNLDDVWAGRTKIKRTITQELGRIPDADEMRQIAAELCRIKPSTRKAIGMIRACRGVQRNGSADGLARVIVRAINGYLNAHRDLAWREVRHAIQHVEELVGED